MKKRILSMLLASLIFTTSFSVQTQAAEGAYNVSLISASDSKTVSVQDAVTVTVMVSGSEGKEKYNAYDFKLKFDPAHLILESWDVAEGDSKDVTYKDGDDVIRLKGYGDDKDFSTAAVTLNFKVKVPGKTSVSLTHAIVDNSDNAVSEIASKATILKETVSISVEGVAVEVVGAGKDGIEVNSYVATNEDDYVFRLRDHKGLDYSITVTFDDDENNMTPELTYNEETGEYTIPKELIEEVKEKIVITSDPAPTPKTFLVTITGDDVTGEKTTEYNTPYSFTLNREEGYIYSIAVTIGEKEYSQYNVVDDVYTIPGADITGDIKITVTKYEDDSNKAKVTFAGAGAKDGSGQKRTEKYVEYPFQIKRKKGYTYSVTVYVDGKKSPYDYDYELDTYYILSENVTGNIVIVIGKIATIEAIEYITLDKQNIYLIVYNGVVNEGQVPKYDGRSMYFSSRYNAYAWLVESATTDKKVKKEAEGKIILSEGLAAGEIDYSGNVNMTLQTDVEDILLVREMYEGNHSLAFMEMKKLLSADTYSDKKLNIRDAVTIVNGIYQEGEHKSE